MLYIFARNNSLQIAWGSQAPRKSVESRSAQLDTSIARLGFVRTRNAG